MSDDSDVLNRSDQSKLSVENAPRQEVDVDSLEVEIYILAKNAKKLDSTCSFLTRRGWPTQVSSNVSSAIEYIAEKRPDYVLISVNHPSPAVIKLPELLMQTFNVAVIAFAEQGDAGTAQILNRIKLANKISGQPSGPNFHRAIRKILSDRFNPSIEENKSGGMDLSAQGGSSSVNVRGGTSYEGQNINFKDASSHDSSIVNTSSNTGYMPDHNSSGSDSTSTSGVYVQKGAESSIENQGANVMHGQKLGEMHSRSQESARSQSHNAHQSDGSGHGQQGGSVNAKGVGAGDSKSARQENSDEISSGKYTIGQKRNRKLKDLLPHQPGSGGQANFDGSIGGQGNVGNRALSQAELLGKLKQSLFGESGEDKSHSGNEEEQGSADASNSKAGVTRIESSRGSDKPQTLLEQAVGKAVITVCKISANREPASLKPLSRLGIVPVDSPTTSGYIVLALNGLSVDVQREFFAVCEKSLGNTFMTMGIPGKLESGFWLDVPTVKFEKWASASGSFSMKLSHEGTEIGVAFFASEQGMPKIQPHEDKSMLFFSIDDLATNYPVTFKAYLHLKENKKFYLYLRNGRELQPEQKNRLKESKVTDIFLKTVDQENLRAFFAGAFLRGTFVKSDDEAA